jgi:acetolactate synthase-1/2/3 large subunit
MSPENAPNVSPNTAPCTVGELIAAFLEFCEVKVLFGVISIHNMPILDAVKRRGTLRYVPARGEAGAANMADAHARTSGGIGVVITSTGTACGNAAGAMVEAQTAGSRLLHLTGQIETEYLDRDMAYIHEAKDQLGLLKAVSKQAFRVTTPEQALPTLLHALQVLEAAPSGPVSVEIPIDVQGAQVELPSSFKRLSAPPLATGEAEVEALAGALSRTRRPMIWAGGGARQAREPLQRLMELGFGLVTTTQGRGVIEESSEQSLGSFTASPVVESLYQTCDAMLVVGSRLRGNETLKYRLKLPQPLLRIDADATARDRCYPNTLFVQGDAREVLTSLADKLAGRVQVDPEFATDLRNAKAQAEARLREDLGVYAQFVEALSEAFLPGALWVRDITISNSMWGNRLPRLQHPGQGIHATGGGIGQGLAMGIGAALARPEQKTFVLVGDGGLQLGLAELATAVEEQANLLLIVMNSQSYEVIKNIQDAHYEGRRGYTDLLTPNLQLLCESVGLPYRKIRQVQESSEALGWARQHCGPVMVEVDMPQVGPFAKAFAGPPVRRG